MKSPARDRLARLSWLAIPAVILWAIWPLVAHAWGHVVDTRTLYPDVWRTIEPDIWLQIWILAWGAHILPTDPLSLYQANAFHPTPNVLARSDHLLGMLPSFAPVWWTTGNPVFAFQVTMIASYLVCGLAMFALLRHLRCTRPVAITVAILWALMGFRVNDGLARAQLLQYQFLPLVVLFFDRWLERARWRDLGFASLFLLWQTMTAYWHAYFAMFTAAATIFAALATRGTRDGRRIAWALGAFAMVGAVLVVTSLPYLEMSREGELVPKSLPARLSWYWGSPSFPFAVGVAAIAGVVASMAAFRRSAADVECATTDRVRRAATTFLLVAVTGVLLSLGSADDGASMLDRMLAAPRDLASAVVPGFRYLRDEYRFLTLASVGIYGLAALGLQGVFTAAGERGRVIATAVLAVFALQPGAALVSLRIPVTPALAASEPPAVYAWLAEHGDGGAVLELPISKNLTDAHLEAGYMFFSTWHWLPLLNGYTGHPPRAHYDHVRALAFELPSAGAIDALARETGLRWIVAHGDVAATWPPSSHLRLVGEFDEAHLYEVLR